MPKGDNVYLFTKVHTTTTNMNKTNSSIKHASQGENPRSKVALPNQICPLEFAYPLNVNVLFNIVELSWIYAHIHIDISSCPIIAE